MTDTIVKAVAASGLLLQLGAIAAGLSGFGWRWPLLTATAVVSLGILLPGMNWRRMDTFDWSLLSGVLISLAAAGLLACSESPAAAWFLRIVFGIQLLVVILLLLFMLCFRMNRLW